MLWARRKKRTAKIITNRNFASPNEGISLFADTAAFKLVLIGASAFSL
jgi:hypothetical protein